MSSFNSKHHNRKKYNASRYAAFGRRPLRDVIRLYPMSGSGLDGHSQLSRILTLLVVLLLSKPSTVTSFLVAKHQLLKMKKVIQPITRMELLLDVVQTLNVTAESRVLLVMTILHRTKLTFWAYLRRTQTVQFTMKRTIATVFLT